MDELIKPANEGLDYLFEDGPVKPTGNGLEDLSEETVGDSSEEICWL